MLNMIKLAALGGLAAMLASSSARAKVTPETYFFYARVLSSSGPGVPQPGDIIPITVKVDVSFPVNAHVPHSHVMKYIGGAEIAVPSPILGISINHNKVFSGYDEIDVAKNNAGSSGIVIGSNSAHGYGFNMEFNTTISGVVRSFKIPKRIYPGNFQSATFSASLERFSYFSGSIVE